MAAGLMINRGSLGELSGGDSVFLVTEAGKEIVRSQSPPPETKKLTRSQQRYVVQPNGSIPGVRSCRFWTEFPGVAQLKVETLILKDPDPRMEPNL